MAALEGSFSYKMSEVICTSFLGQLVNLENERHILMVNKVRILRFCLIILNLIFWRDELYIDISLLFNYL